MRAAVFGVMIVLVIVVIAGFAMWRSKRSSCRTDADCTAPNICIGGSCGATTLPRPPPGPQCVTNANCAGGLVCDGLRCVAPSPPGQTVCYDDSDCTAPQTCSGGNPHGWCT